MNEPPDYDDPLTPDPMDDSTVLVFRNGAGAPVAVPAQVVTAAERAYRCYQDRISGKTWAAIAEHENYPSATAAAADVGRYMAEAKALVVEGTQKEMLTLEIFRLDAIQAAIWPGAMAGNIQAARLVIDVVMNRAKLLGLDSGDIGSNEGAHTLVVPTDRAGYLAAMQAASTTNGRSQPVRSEHTQEEKS